MSLESEEERERDLGRIGGSKIRCDVSGSRGDFGDLGLIPCK